MRKIYEVKFFTSHSNPSPDLDYRGSHGLLVVCAHSLRGAIDLAETKLAGFCGDDIEIVAVEEIDVAPDES